MIKEWPIIYEQILWHNMFRICHKFLQCIHICPILQTLLSLSCYKDGRVQLTFKFMLKISPSLSTPLNNEVSSHQLFPLTKYSEWWGNILRRGTRNFVCSSLQIQCNENIGNTVPCSMFSWTVLITARKEFILLNQVNN